MTSDLHLGYLGFGAHLPSTVLTNEDLEAIVDTSDEWIQRRTGIRTRRILEPDESILGMAVAAARQALDDAGVAGEDLDDIRVGVNTWLRFPSLATQVQKELGAKKASASDVSAGCAGFIYAVEEACNRLWVEAARYGRDGGYALVIGVDGLSHITDWEDRGTCVLLGDGAGAVVLGPVERGGILAIHTHADGRYGHLLNSDHILENQQRTPGEKSFTHKAQGVRPYLHMDGPKVYSVAVRTMARDVRTVLDKYNRANGATLGLGDVDFVFPHQANLRIIEAVARKLKIPDERVYTAGVQQYGNTSTASIPIGYRDNRERWSGAAADRYEVDVAFGAGFASGAILRQEGALDRRRQ